ncbi:MarR family winged helix-turn-helix transcriptional regulator [Bacillus suaedaesalsae]|uniref:MarR family transcriptional regulator n=1 Tax=Bacillus suaedaesalsae TaxID=2810349 RepID=A0ABS2DHY3_9BACI|nr:MarR family transcriptional regulator [Bacillus suaedaesalsae]MBM6618085.1 MarR family transcriptional regulator [Bacillus suaedaesalsae]
MDNRKDVETSLKLFVVLSRAYRSVGDLANKSIQRFGLNPTEFAVLELLYHKGETPLQQIGGKILIASGSITYVVDKLEKKGLLARKQCSKDRRVTYATLTDDGMKFMKEIFPEHEQFVNEIQSSLSLEEKEQLVIMLKKLGHGAKDHNLNK